MDGVETGGGIAELERELVYYRRECNDLGARLLRLQEEQSQAFREARRSRTVAKLIREAYRLADQESSPDEIGNPMLEIIVENTLCDRAAFLRRTDFEGVGGSRFAVTHAIGLPVEAEEVRLPAVPNFFFTTSRTPIEPPAYELTAILRVPYVLWVYDRGTGRALIIGNQSEGNITRPFEAADQELVEGALSVYIDVLRRKRGEVELRAATAAAEQASAARARFMATLSHELRTPLNAIIGFSELLGAEHAHRLEPARRDQYAGQILQSGRNLLALINDILDYSSLSKTAPMLQLEWRGVGAVLDDVAGEATALALRAGVELLVQAPEQAWEVRVDRRRFHQVLNNLVGNAIKFTPAGGRVTLRCVAEPDGGVCIVVDDTGVGMRQEDVGRALEPFQQLQSGHARGFPGAGLGLPIAAGLAAAHGCTLDIASAPDTGTAVHVRFPAALVRIAPPSADA